MKLGMLKKSRDIAEYDGAGSDNSAAASIQLNKFERIIYNLKRSNFQLLESFRPAYAEIAYQ